MSDALEQALAWAGDGPVGLATVVSVSGSAPRQVGAVLAVSADGVVAGSVSGGCVEGAVYELARDVVGTGEPVVRAFGSAEESPFEVGLTCGGRLEVYVERLDARRARRMSWVLDEARAGRSAALVTVLAHPDPAQVGRMLVVGHPAGLVAEETAGLDPALTRALVAEAEGHLAAGRSALMAFGPRGERQRTEVRAFVRCLCPAPRLIVVGAADYAGAVTRLGSFLGYAVTVVDARSVFATPARFPEAHEVVVDWPHRYLRAEAAAGRVPGSTVICVLTHDPKFDVPVLEVALRLPDVAYVGALGSRRTHRDRVGRLRAAGVTDAELVRLSSPVGLDLGARTPEETAVSILAEVIANRWDRSGRRLGELRGPIHDDETDDASLPLTS